jgi:predicted alpha/beta superfamily hydrolase
MPTIVLHDEQNLRDPKTSTDGTTWELDAALAHVPGLEAITFPHAGKQRAHEYVGDGLDAHMARVLARVEGASAPLGIGGSSFGAYASLYVWAKNTDRFTRVLAMSPALWVNRDRLFDTVGRADGRGTRVWIDVGGRESQDPVYQERYAESYREMRALLEERGCDVGGYFDPDAIHHESAWAGRLPEALRYLYAHD